MGHNSPYGGMRPSVTVYVAALGGTMRCTNLTRKNFKFQSSPGDFIVTPPSRVVHLQPLEDPGVQL